MEKNSFELLFYTGEDGLLHLFSMCIDIEPENEYGINYCSFPVASEASANVNLECDAPRFSRSASYHIEERLERQKIEREEEHKALLEEFKYQAKSLMDLGFTDEEILDIIKDCRKRNRIFIDKHFRIFLVDQAMQEVEMNPLSKTLFLFYLKHPEGVALKCLSDYKAELSSIYSKLTGRESVEDIEKSIRDLVDPTSNSVHEKCSRIKAAFRDKVYLSTIDDYVPSGLPGEPRFISLDRNLVTWEGSL